ncbi:MAG: hypothetical protein KAS13_03705 [Candidatus Omnitrophica bacterium]|nr:hypothetical protein [Candidatus Omnitrophota bacterium]
MSKLIGKENIVAVLFIVILVSLYTLPLLLNIDKGLIFNQKNYEGMWYSICTIGHSYYSGIMKNHELPFWAYFYEGGFFVSSVFDEISFNPFSILILAFGVVKGINLHYYLMYILGALSMFYLTRIVLKFDLFGAIYSSLVFSMCGLFPMMQIKGFSSARETLLLPLLTAFFLKTIYSNRYILPTALLLGFFLCTGLYFPIMVLFLFILVILNSFQKESDGFSINKRYLVVFFTVLISSLCLAAFKLFLIIEFLSVESGSSGHPYLQSIEKANTFVLLMKHLTSTRDSTMYVGWLPLWLSFLSITILFKKMKNWLIILLMFCVFSLGSNSFIDLHYLLWRLPIFNAIDELEKYYALIIMFTISLLAGGFFTIINKSLSKVKGVVLSIGLIFFTFLNLLITNGPYFNEFRGDLALRNKDNGFCQAKMINYQEGDDSGMPALGLSLYLNDMGVINQRYDRYFQKLENENISPKYFIMPGYVFLSPSTKLIVISNPDYKGEVYFTQKENKAELLSITQNHIKISVHLKSKDRLIINQNYLNWWKSKASSVENYNGLLSLSLDKLGDYEIKLYFFPLNFYVGLGISIISMMFFVFVLWPRYWRSKT